VCDRAKFLSVWPRHAGAPLLTNIVSAEIKHPHFCRF
jgi:hypothetical protein